MTDLSAAPSTLPGPGAVEPPEAPVLQRALAWARGWTPREWALLDVVVAVVSFVGLTLPVLLGVPSRDGNPVAIVALGAASTLPIAVRRRWPLPALVVIVAAITASLALGVRTTPFVSNAGPGVALTVYTAVSRSDTTKRRVWILGTTCMVISLGYAAALAWQDDYEHNAVHSLLAVAGWWVGENVRTQRAYRAALAERDREEAAERERRARAEERLRLSREVHDVVSHSLSVIAVRSGVGRMVAADRPDEAVAALAAIETASRGALDELRRVLATTRDTTPPASAGEADDAAPAGPDVAGAAATAGPPDVPAPAGIDGAGGGASGGAPPGAGGLDLAPAPGLGDVAGLVERMAAGGLDVALHHEEAAASAPLPPMLEQSAYRIVQEGLTNIVMHVGGTHAEVTVVRLPDGVTVEVVDDGPDTGGAPLAPLDARPIARGGFGLIGVGERVALFGGGYEAGPRPGGGFRLAAHLPVHPPAAVVAGSAAGGGGGA